MLLEMTDVWEEFKKELDGIKANLKNSKVSLVNKREMFDFEAGMGGQLRDLSGFCELVKLDWEE